MEITLPAWYRRGVQANARTLPHITLRNRDGSTVVLFPAGLTQVSNDASQGGIDLTVLRDAELSPTDQVGLGAPQAGRITPSLRLFLSVRVEELRREKRKKRAS